ncbi:type-IV secretion system protein TraC [Thermoplasmatales archaeon]|nr:type-IV secretion system protein TraC [Thermoplasmatales archaeon]
MEESKAKVSVERKFRITGPQAKIGNSFAFLSLTDAEYDSAGMYCSLVESTNLRLKHRVSFSPLPVKASERIIARMRASRVSEMRYEEKRNRTRYLQLKRHVHSLEQLLGSISGNNHRIYKTSLQIILDNSHPVELSRGARRLISSLGFMGLTFKIDKHLTKQHIVSLLTPFFYGKKEYLMDSLSVASILPLHFEQAPPTGGIAVGVDDLTEKPVFLELFNGNSFNVLSFGETGSGKSFFSKLILRRLIITGAVDHIYIIDPLGEYGSSIFPEDSTVINIGKGDYLDPLRDARNNTETLDAIFSMLMHYDPDIMDDARNMRYILSEYLEIDGTRTMKGLLQFIRSKDSGHASARIISELLSTAFLNEVVPDDRRIIIFRTGQYIDPGNEHSMVSILLSLISMISSTAGRKVILVDEAHNLIDNSACAALLDMITRHARHYDTSVISMTQNPEDFFTNPRSRSLLLNSSRIFGFRTKSSNALDYSISGNEAFKGVDFASLMGGKTSPYSECVVFSENHLRKVRILCTEREKYLIDGINN